jgi:TRAP-type C4-dicarboxylate transport system permease small subunit
MAIGRVASRLSSWLNPLCRGLGYIASVTLFAMMCLTMADVLMRKFMNHSILGTVELTELMMVVIVFFTLGFSEMKDAHIKVDVFASKLKRPTQTLLDVVTQFLGFLLFALMTVSVLRHAITMQKVGEVTQDLWIPKYPFLYLSALGCAVLSVALFFRFLAFLSERVKP